MRIQTTSDLQLDYGRRMDRRDVESRWLGRAFSRWHACVVMRSRAILGVACMSVLAGCATPMPVLTDFSEIKAEVRVAYDDIAGPSFEDALQSANPVAAEHCGSMGKSTVYVSGRAESEYAGSLVTDGGEYGGGVRSTNIYATEYVFLYRCESTGVTDPGYPQ